MKNKLKKYFLRGVKNKEKNVFEFQFDCIKCGIKCNFTLPHNSKAKRTKICNKCLGNRELKEAVWFKNALTDDEVYVTNVSQFAASFPELGVNAKYHFSQVIHGNRIHNHGWYLRDKIKIDKEKIKTAVLLKRAIAN